MVVNRRFIWELHIKGARGGVAVCIIDVGYVDNAMLKRSSAY